MKTRIVRASTAAGEEVQVTRLVPETPEEVAEVLRREAAGELAVGDGWTAEERAAVSALRGRSRSGSAGAERASGRRGRLG